MNIWDSVHKSLEKASHGAGRIAQIQRLRSQTDKLMRQVNSQENALLTKTMELFQAGKLENPELQALCQELTDLHQSIHQTQQELQRIQSQGTMPDGSTAQQAALPPPPGTQSIAYSDPSMYEPAEYATGYTEPTQVEQPPLNTPELPLEAYPHTLPATPPPPPPPGVVFEQQYPNQEGPGNSLLPPPPPPPGSPLLPPTGNIAENTIYAQPPVPGPGESASGEDSEIIMYQETLRVAEAAKPAQARGTNCPGCGASILPNHRFCEHCGLLLPNNDISLAATSRSSSILELAPTNEIAVNAPEDNATVRAEPQTNEEEQTPDSSENETTLQEKD